MSSQWLNIFFPCKPLLLSSADVMVQWMLWAVCFVTLELWVVWSYTSSQRYAAVRCVLLVFSSLEAITSCQKTWLLPLTQSRWVFKRARILHNLGFSISQGILLPCLTLAFSFQYNMRAEARVLALHHPPPPLGPLWFAQEGTVGWCAPAHVVRTATATSSSTFYSLKNIFPTLHTPKLREPLNKKD